MERAAGHESETKHDVDVLFKDLRDGCAYYLEVKYNDDHDTGKYVDINRKFLKTYAGLVSRLNISSPDQLTPILYYLTPKVMKGNIYVPESTNILRGPGLFERFFSLAYEDLDRYLASLGEDREILALFDETYERIRRGPL